MRCPKCHNVLLFPDEDDRISRQRQCAICGWTQELDRHGQPLEPLPYNTGAENEERQLRSGGHGNHYKARVDGKYCDVSPDCIRCPLPACKYDDWNGYWRWFMAQPERAPWGGHPPEPLTEALVREESQRLGVTDRTVWRRLQKMREG